MRGGEVGTKSGGVPSRKNGGDSGGLLSAFCEKCIKKLKNYNTVWHFRPVGGRLELKGFSMQFERQGRAGLSYALALRWYYTMQSAHNGIVLIIL